MSRFTDFVDGLKDEAGVLARGELKDLVARGKRDPSAFVRTQAENLERWTLLLASGDLTPKGYALLVRKMEVLTELENLKLSVAARASARRLGKGIRRLVLDGLLRLI